MKRGKIITFEGTDGTGKDTQVERLVSRMTSEGIPVYSTTFPDYNSVFGQIIDQHKKGKFEHLDLSIKDISWTFAADRKIIQHEFDELLIRGVNIVLGRYLESNQAYQGSKLHGDARKEMMDWLKMIEIDYLGIRPSDHVLWLELPAEYTLQALAERKKETGNPEKDIYDDAAKQVHIARYETYRTLAQQPNWITVPCVKKDEMPARRYTRDELEEIIWGIVNPLIK